MIQENFNHHLESILKGAGAILLSYFRKETHERIKPGTYSTVTDADMASEAYLIEHLKKLLPEAHIISEESHQSTDKADEGYCWVIDPLDGTTNFAHGIPYFCVSVALTKNGKPIVGALYQPITQEFFYAREGNGAFLNGTKIKIFPESRKRSLMVIGLPYAKNIWYKKLVEAIKNLRDQKITTRQFGATALDLAYVAAGCIDGVVLADLAWWDVAAGMVLVQEAGGVVQDFNGKEIDKNYKSLVAGSTKTVKYVRETIIQK